MNNMGFGQLSLPLGQLRRPRQQMASRLMNEGVSTEPVQHFTQGLGRMAKMLLGIKLQNQLEEQDRARQANMGNTIQELMSEKIVDAPASTIPPQALQSNMPESGPDNIRDFGDRYFEEQRPDDGVFTPMERLTLKDNQGMTTQSEDIVSKMIGANKDFGASMSPFGDQSLMGNISMEMRPKPLPDEVRYGPETVIPEQSHMGLSKLGQALMAMNQNTPGGADPSLMFNLMMQKDLAKQSRENQLTDAETAFNRKKQLAGIRANSPTSSMKDWQMAQTNPGYMDFLTKTGSKNIPNSVAEWNFYDKLPSAQKEQYLGMKRAVPHVDAGGQHVFPSQVNPAGPPTATIPKTLAPAQTPNYLATAAKKKEEGKQQGAAAANLPKVNADAELILDVVDQALNHPGREGVTGMPNILTLGGLVPGTDEANYRDVARQIKGQTFLSAFERIKGGGHITEIEGAKAAQAMARLDESQSDEEYANSLREFKYYVQKGMELAKKRANPNYKMKKIPHFIKRPHRISKEDWAEATDEEKQILAGGNK